VLGALANNTVYFFDHDPNYIIFGRCSTENFGDKEHHTMYAGVYAKDRSKMKDMDYYI
jgi:hypothetical protein